ncbi:MAG: hypothetical protein NTZ05_16820 [Chloroflexi bacterium]|nr:hypothetical protein [Chloroflexota bacterium]
MQSDQDEFFAKAQEGLLAAEAALDAGWFTVCARTAYFAAYHAAIAALMHEGIVDRKGDWAHKFVAGTFAEQLVRRRKVYAAVLGGVLAEGMHLRHTADYAPRPISRTQAARGLRDSQQLVHAITDRLRNA